MQENKVPAATNHEIAIHIPFIRVDSKHVDILGGSLTYASTDRLQSLDRDWMRDSFLKESRPMYLISNIKATNSQSALDQEFLRAIEFAELFVHAIISITGAELLSPRTSTSYISSTSGKPTIRHIGPFARTLVLHNPHPVEISQSVAIRAAEIAETWAANASNSTYVRHILSRFSVLEAISLSSQHYAFRLLPLIIALERMLVPGVKNGIQRAMIDTLRELHTDELEFSSKTIRQAYDCRSRIIHGESTGLTLEKFSMEQYFDLRLLFGSTIRKLAVKPIHF